MRWNWIDRILRHDPGERLDAIKVVSLSEDHLHEHFVDAPCMPSSLMIEGMAQTAGILVGAISNFERRVILAKIARAEFHTDAFPGDQIRYSATLERIADAGASTKGTVEIRRADELEFQRAGHVDLFFSHLDGDRAPDDLPEGNFVFSDNFKILLDGFSNNPYCEPPPGTVREQSGQHREE